MNLTNRLVALVLKRLAFIKKFLLIAVLCASVSGCSEPQESAWNPQPGYSRDGEWCEYGVSPLIIESDGHKIGGWCYAPCAPNCGSDVDLEPMESDNQYGRW